MINIADLKVGDVVITGDSYGYDKVEVVKALYFNETYKCNGVDIKHYGEKDENAFWVGGIPGWEPLFYPI